MPENHMQDHIADYRHTVVCRCEDLTLADIRGLIQDHEIVDFDTLKRISRCSMGACQGKNCRRLALQVLAESLDVSPDSLQPDNIRPPTRPVSLRALFRHE